jgi:hypothetical protein
MTTLRPNTDEYVTFLAARNVLDGILYEPRLKAQLFDFSAVGASATVKASDDATFLNAEQYPVRITHVVAAIRDQGPNPEVNTASSDPRLVQRFGLRIRAHDTFYMNDEFVRLPLWGTEVIAGANPISRSVASWKFGYGKDRIGVFMGGKDNFEVMVALEYPVNPNTEEGLGVWVTFHGVGAISRRPKQITGYRTFTSADGVSSRSMGAGQMYLNDGTEPLEITHVTTHAQAANGTAGADPAGNIRRIRVSIRQVGNGTNQRWTTTPQLTTSPPAFNMADCIPATLWGLTAGQAIVHELPKNSDGYPGWLWQPNSGLTLEVQPAAGVQAACYIGLAGHIVVK